MPAPPVVYGPDPGPVRIIIRDVSPKLLGNAAGSNDDATAQESGRCGEGKSGRNSGEATCADVDGSQTLVTHGEGSSPAVPLNMDENNGVKQGGNGSTTNASAAMFRGGATTVTGGRGVNESIKYMRSSKLLETETTTESISREDDINVIGTHAASTDASSQLALLANSIHSVDREHQRVKGENNDSDRSKSDQAALKSVRFASTNRVRQFGSECAVSSLLEENESQMALRNTFGKVVRKKKRVRLMDALESTGSTSSAIASIMEDDECLRQTFCGPSHQNEQPLAKQHTRKHPIQIVLIHSQSHTQILHHAMRYIHQDRDILLESLLKWCGIFHGTSGDAGPLSSFLRIVPPKTGTRKLLEQFHDTNYLDMLEFPLEQYRSFLSMKSNGEGTGDATMRENQHVDETASGSETCSESSGDQFVLPCGSAYAQLPNEECLKYGLEDDCPFPTTPQAHALLWKYCLAVSGASWHAASLLTSDESGNKADVAIHWGGGRHHAHASKAGGFCYVSDVILAILRLLHSHDGQIDIDLLEHRDRGPNKIQNSLSFRRILYIDVDIHHADAVQAAFYATSQVMCVSFHRFSPGFFPASSGSLKEKGVGAGLGYNLNVPLPAGIGDVQFIEIYRKVLFGLVKAYNPHVIVLCVGADGIEGDPLVSGSLDGDAVTGEGWELSPEGLAECVRIVAALCAGLDEREICTSYKQKRMESNISMSMINEPKDDSTENSLNADNDQKPKASGRGAKRKLLILGGGGYNPAQTARSYLLCSAAACEGARPGMLWSDLPRDIPSHDYFPRYGPSFELVSGEKKDELLGSYSSTNKSNSSGKEEHVGELEPIRAMPDSDRQILKEANRAVELAILYIDRQREKHRQEGNFSYDTAIEKEGWPDRSQRKKKCAGKGGGRRRKKKKPEIRASPNEGETSSS
ncbi:hypothetical protein ACHAWF_014177 [Thalassiosira exigua]